LSTIRTLNFNKGVTNEEYDNVNRGQIWKNENRKTDTHPQFTGSINIEGKEHWLSGWTRKADANPKAPAMSFSVNPKEPKAETINDSNSLVNNEFEDSIPFR